MKPPPRVAIATVTELTQAIDWLLTEGIGEVRVSGEVFNFKMHSSGHRYFKLKDENSTIECTIWKRQNISLNIVDGMKVIVEGKLSIYPAKSQYQINCYSITQQGKGDLYLAFEALKQELAAKGYFDPARKKPLPSLAWKIGVVTSATGAAIEDIKTTINRRLSACTIYLCPATVQGENAPSEIAEAIYTLNQTDCQAIIVGRGGGSLEDLWAFNTRIVARAIYDSEIPIISAVGHETDFTIADFVADVRAATPTAAAELVTQRDKAELLDIIEEKQDELWAIMKEHLQEKKRQLKALENSYALQKFSDRLHNYAQRVDEAEERLGQAAKRALTNRLQRLNALEFHLASLHPLSPLRRGFALLRSNNRMISPSESLEAIETVEIVRQREIARAKIEEIRPTDALLGE